MPRNDRVRSTSARRTRTIHVESLERRELLHAQILSNLGSGLATRPVVAETSRLAQPVSPPTTSLTQQRPGLAILQSLAADRPRLAQALAHREQVWNARLQALQVRQQFRPSLQPPHAQSMAHLRGFHRDPFAQPNGRGGVGGGKPSPSSSPYTPQQIRSAYGFDKLTQDGTGITIAIVDAYDDPTIFNDVNYFSAQFSLPAMDTTTGNNVPTFTKVDQNGGTSFPAYNSGWAGEIALDVEWAHAIAPGADILLVEAKSNSFDDLLAAVDYAKTHADVVSLSWGSGEFSGETAYDSRMVQAGVTFVASSGDSGGVISWPAISPTVVSVGGTSLQINTDGSWKGETGWSGSGGGVSNYEAKPAFQSALSYARRANPDVGYNADPNTGVYVFDSSGGTNAWYKVGGTSAGAPQWAALVALADQGRLASGKSTLDGASQLLPALYQQVSTSHYHDITSGRAGRNRAGTGYDLVTGLGSPLAQLVVQDLINA